MFRLWRHFPKWPEQVRLDFVSCRGMRGLRSLRSLALSSVPVKGDVAGLDFRVYGTAVGTPLAAAV